MAESTPSQKRILIAEADLTSAKELTARLQQAGYAVQLVQNTAEVAQLTAPGIDLVITKLELLTDVKHLKPIPVILIADLTSIPDLSTVALADEVLSEPLRLDELVATTAKLLAQKPGKSVSLDKSAAPTMAGDSDYCKVNIDDFISGKEMKFDIFIRLTADKYVKIAHRGETLALERIKAYKTKSVGFLALRKDDFRTYLGFNVQIMGALRTKPGIGAAKRVQLYRHTTELGLENLFRNDLDRGTYDASKTFIEGLVSAVADDADLFSVLDSIRAQDEILHAHSLAVSLYGVMVARHIQWTSTRNIFKIAIAGLLHDIGMKELDRALLTKEPHELNASEKIAYESHPAKGLALLKDVRSISDDILLVISQHHESHNANGFPGRVRASQIHPLARLISIVSEFCHYTLPGAHKTGLAPLEAIKKIMTTEAGTGTETDVIGSVFLLGLMKLFKLPPPARFLAAQKHMGTLKE